MSFRSRLVVSVVVLILAGFFASQAERPHSPRSTQVRTPAATAATRDPGLTEARVASAPDEIVSDVRTPSETESSYRQMEEQHLPRLGGRLVEARDSRWEDAAAGFVHTNAGALAVTLPRNSDETLTLTADGHTLSITALDRSSVPVRFEAPAVESTGTEPNSAWAALFPWAPDRYRLTLPTAGNGREGVALYENALPETDVVWVAQQDRAEEYLWLRSASAPRIFRYRVNCETLPGLRPAGPTWEFLNETGMPVMRLHPAVAWDATGREVQVSLQIEEDENQTEREIVLALEETDAQFPVLVDPGWSSSKSMVNPRDSHIAVRLNTGEVLVAGGVARYGGEPLASAEVYYPGTDTWGAIASMWRKRITPSGVVLKDGTVLVMGGSSGSTEILRTTERLHPSVLGLDKSSWVSTGDMQHARVLGSATLAPNGEVWMTGGLRLWITKGFLGIPSLNTEVYRSVEIYTPQDFGGSWRRGPDMGSPRMGHSAVTVPGISGQGSRIVCAGGITNADASVNLMKAAASIEFRETASVEAASAEGGGFQFIGSMGAPRANMGTAVLPDGTAVFTGGANGIRIENLKENQGNESRMSYNPSNVVDRLSPGAATVQGTAWMRIPRAGHVCLPLRGGLILVAGGERSLRENRREFVTAGELYDSQKPEWAGTAEFPLDLPGGRSGGVAVLLADGAALWTGGISADGGNVSPSCVKLDLPKPPPPPAPPAPPVVPPPVVQPEPAPPAPQPPAELSKDLSPSGGKVIRTPSVTLRWNPVSGATEYEVMVEMKIHRQTGPFWRPHWSYITRNHQKMLWPAQPNRFYRFCVRARTTEGWSAWSDWADFSFEPARPAAR